MLSLILPVRPRALRGPRGGDCVACDGSLGRHFRQPLFEGLGIEGAIPPRRGLDGEKHCLQAAAHSRVERRGPWDSVGVSFPTALAWDVIVARIGEPGREALQQQVGWCLCRSIGMAGRGLQDGHQGFDAVVRCQRLFDFAREEEGALSQVGEDLHLLDHWTPHHRARFAGASGP